MTVEYTGLVHLTSIVNGNSWFGSIFIFALLPKSMYRSWFVPSRVEYPLKLIDIDLVLVPATLESVVSVTPTLFEFVEKLTLDTLIFLSLLFTIFAVVGTLTLPTAKAGGFSVQPSPPAPARSYTMSPKGRCPALLFA